jgi:hypothetical protein
MSSRYPWSRINSKKDGYGTWGSFSTTVSTMGAHVEINGGTFNTTKTKLFANNNFVYVDITGGDFKN